MRRVLCVALIFAACATSGDPTPAKQRAVRPGGNDSWTRGAVFYEVFVRSFYDSNGDGKGDLPGLTSKLDYIQSLGANAIWLMPVFQSPSYHGYDTTDYETINSDYGTNADFQQFLAEAHKRNIRVIIDYVMNHTSDQHPWFSTKHDWYVWSPTNPGWTQPWSNDPTWHPLGGEFYYGLFWSGMPDLNYRTPAVKDEMFRIAREWLANGVDGFRLDATRYLIEDGPGAGQADTPETHQLLKDFTMNVKATKPDAALVAENTVDTPTLATYFADVPMNFNFPLADAIVKGVYNGIATNITSTLRQMLAVYPADAVDAPFLTNHDQTRIASVMQNDNGKLRDAAAILLTLPGAPFIYYGEEVGLQNCADSRDECKRTPMPWTASGGFTTGTPWFPYSPGTSTQNVAAETNDPNSLLSYYRNWINARHSSAALVKGTIVPLDVNTQQVLAFERDAGSERVLVLHNVSALAANVTVTLTANGFDVLYADSGAQAPPTGSSGSWRFALGAHSSATWRIH